MNPGVLFFRVYAAEFGFGAADTARTWQRAARPAVLRDIMRQSFICFLLGLPVVDFYGIQRASCDSRRCPRDEPEISCGAPMAKQCHKPTVSSDTEGLRENC